MTPSRRRPLWLMAGAAILGSLALASLLTGSRDIAVSDSFQALWAYDPHNDQHLIVRALRLPRTLAAALAGAALGVAGALMQALTRNPLAEPGLLGVNAGAALAVAVGVTVFGLSSILHYVWFAFAGAGIAAVAVFILGRAQETGTNPVRLLLAGAGLSIMLTSLSATIILNAPAEAFDHFRKWMAGSVEGTRMEVVASMGLCLLAGLGLAGPMAGNLNALAMGQDLGRALGVNVRLTLFIACLAIIWLAGAATAAAGPIGFVGLVAPHVARSLMGPDYRWILPASALYAAVLLLAADILGRVVAPPSEVAAGIIASLIGGPFFIYIVRRFRMARL